MKTYSLSILAALLTTVAAAAQGDAPKSVPKAGFVIGRILASNGKPISVPDVKFVRFEILGIATKSAEKIFYVLKANADGRYEQKLVDGSYHFNVNWLEVKYNEKMLRVDLEPLGDDKADRGSEKGIVQDYVWKINGLRPGRAADEAERLCWYGGSVRMRYATDRPDRKNVPLPPKGTKYVFTLVPKGKLLDGSAGKVLTFTREFDLFWKALEKNGNLHDIPLGAYRVTGVEVSPTNTKKAIVLWDAKSRQYLEAVELHFETEPGRFGIRQAYLNFAR